MFQHLNCTRWASIPVTDRMTERQTDRNTNRILYAFAAHAHWGIIACHLKRLCEWFGYWATCFVILFHLGWECCMVQVSSFQFLWLAESISWVQYFLQSFSLFSPGLRGFKLYVRLWTVFMQNGSNLFFLSYCYRLTFPSPFSVHSVDQIGSKVLLWVLVATLLHQPDKVWAYS